MSTTMTDRRWFEIERKIPLALVFGFILQTGGALFWAGAAAERIARVEQMSSENARVIERVVRLEERVASMHASLNRIETKLDRMDPTPARED
jgi:hypothetical protein